MERKVTFKFVRTTTNTHLYDEVGSDPAVGNIYFKKSFLGEDPPATVEATFKTTAKLKAVS